MVTLNYDDFKERWQLTENLLDAVEILRSRNKNLIQPTPEERRTMVFLETSAKRFIEAIKRDALK